MVTLVTVLIKTARGDMVTLVTVLRRGPGGTLVTCSWSSLAGQTLFRGCEEIVCIG